MIVVSSSFTKKVFPYPPFVLIFAGGPFDPTGVDNLGTMPQNFVVVQAVGDKYRFTPPFTRSE